MTSAEEKVRENRLRRMAARQGMMLRKSPRRDPRAWDYNTWMVCDADTGLVVWATPHGYGIDLKSIADWLEAGAPDEWPETDR
jgi:hypothetical protein